MGIHTFNSLLHQTYSSGDLVVLRSQIIASGWHQTTGFDGLVFANHVGREFNRKASQLGLTELMFTPYDAGFRPDYYSGGGANTLQTIGGSDLLTIGGAALELI